MNTRTKPLFRRLSLGGWIGFWILFAQGLFGGIEFEYKELERVAPFGERAVEFAFPFKNTGDSIVTIREVRSSCGCTVARLDKKAYQPGESGEILGSFDTLGRQGKQVSTLQVYTDEQRGPAHLLRVEMSIPRLLVIQPGLVLWKADQPPETRVVVLKPNQELKVEIVEVICDAPDFEAKLIAPEEGQGEYQVEVTPNSLRKGRRAQIRVKSLREGKETPDWHTIHLRVL